uniref:Reverse transcriptase domain-containing protein n=1 Tax=Tanacetum cinerariifolium TaxID=118510 RepID=A0A6L2LFK6_TANCI|nr:reverse transcriptase domain-containing protein [Tanacetum cinerariifolium]
MKINTASSSGLGTLPSNTVTNPKEDLKGITTRSGIAYKEPTIPTTSSSPEVVERETKVTKDTVPHTNYRSSKDVQPPVVQIETQVPNSEPVVALAVEPVEAPVSALKPNPKPSILYPSRLHDQKLREKANDQKEKFFQIFQDLNFNISFADAFILRPKFGPTIKKKLGDPDKFLILCDFPGMDECLALADLGASINLMPLSMWKMLSLLELSPTCTTLELTDRLISRPVGVAEDVFVKVGKFHFPADFVVVDFDADPRVPLILGRSFLKTGHALIDVYEGELTLRFGKKSVTFNLDQTLRYSANYDAESINRIDAVVVVTRWDDVVVMSGVDCGGDDGVDGDSDEMHVMREVVWLLASFDFCSKYNMSQDVITVGSTMRIPLLYRGEYSQWYERFMSYLEEQTDGEAMINSIQNGDQPLPVIAQVSLAGTAHNDALERQMHGSEYDEQDRKSAILYESVVTRKTTQNQGDVNDALGYKKKAVMVTSDPLALIAEKTKVSKSKEKVVVSSDSEGSEADDFSELKKITALLKVKVKDYEYYKTKMLLAKKDKDEQVLLAVDQAWMESSSDLDQEINANMFFMAQIKKVLSDSEASSSSADEKISEVSYYLFESESESEFENSEYYDNSTNYGLFVNNDDDQEIFHDAIESASENFIDNHIDSQKDYDKSNVDHNDSEEKDHLVDKLISEFKHKIAKCQKHVKKANQQSKDFENQNKDLQEKYDVLIIQVNTFEEKNNEFNDQIKVLNEKNADLLDQTKVLKDQLQVKHVVIDTHVECHEKYAKLEAERYEYMIIYYALFDNDKQHRKQIADQEILFDKMSVELVELDKHVRDLKNTVLEKDFKISELEECVCNKDLEIEKCLERLNDCENKLHKMGQTNQTVHMIIPSKDNLYNGRKRISFENPSYFEKAKDLRPTLYDEKVIGLGYTPIFHTHSDEALKIEKFKRSRENKIEFAYDFGNLNASYVNEKINFEDDYFQDIINPDFEKIDSPFQQTSSLKPYVPNGILEKIIIDLEDEVVSLLEK